MAEIIEVFLAIIDLIKKMKALHTYKAICKNGKFVGEIRNWKKFNNLIKGNPMFCRITIQQGQTLIYRSLPMAKEEAKKLVELANKIFPTDYYASASFII